MKSTLQKFSISLEGAQAVVTAAIAAATEKGVSVSIAVVDESGNERLVARMDEAPYTGPRVATDKAYTAAGFKRTTKELYDFLKDDPQLTLGLPLAVPRVVVFGGGVPIVVDDAVIGAVGVAGSGWQTDEAIAKAGAAVLVSDSQAQNAEASA